MFRSTILVLLSILTLSCTKKSFQQSGSNVAEPPIPPLPRFVPLFQDDTSFAHLDTLIFLKRGACFGRCPAFEYIVFNNGLVRYFGKNFVEPLGVFYSQINEKDFNDIIAKADSIQFFNLADRYPENQANYIPDLPNTTIMINYNLKKKYILDNHSAPKQLKELEILIDDRLKNPSPLPIRK